MKTYRMVWGLRAGIVLAGVESAVAAWQGQYDVALLAGMLALLGWRYGLLAKATRQAMDAATHMIEVSETVVRQNFRLEAALMQKEAEYRALQAQIAAERVAVQEWKERADSIVGQARMVIDGRK